MAALKFLSQKSVKVQEFLPNSPIILADFVVRAQNSEELSKEIAHPVAGFVAVIDCTLNDFDNDVISRLYNDYESQDIVGEKLTRGDFDFYLLDSALREFSETYLSLVSIAFSGCFSPYTVGGNGHPSEELRSKLLVSWGDPEHFLRKYLVSAFSCPVSVESFIEWTKGCRGIWAGSPERNVEKAFSFILNALHPDEGSSDISRLTWGLAALEAISCENNQEIKGKLVRRIPILLGKSEFKNLPKLISRIYDFRSRIFHGDLPITNKISFPDGPLDRNGDHTALAYEYGIVVCAIALSVVWECVKKDSYEIVFSESAQYH